jgi:hypothetical protein
MRRLTVPLLLVAILAAALPAEAGAKRRTYMGRFVDAAFALPKPFKPRQLHPFSADDNAYLYGLRWSRWGRGTARARGKAKANDCNPSCAEGHFVRKRGARARGYRLRSGTCHGKAARFYTRARLRFPPGLGLGTMTVRLKTGCPGD